MDQISYKLARCISFKREHVYAMIFFGAFAFLGLILSTTQILGVSRDYLGYEIFFDLVRLEGLNTLAVSRFEPGFSIFAIFLTKCFASNAVVYGWIVVAAMLLKGWTIRAYSANHWIIFVVAAFYFVRYFPLHELTQLRAACAIALVMVGAIVIWKYNLFLGILICASALSFHMSAAAIIPALLLPSSKRWQVILIALGTFALTSAFSGMVTSYLGNLIKIVEAYETAGFSDTAPNPFAIQLLIDWAIILASLIIWKRLSLLMKRIILLELMGMAIFYGGIDFGVIAHRMREFYSVFWVLFVSDGLRHNDTKLMSYCFIFVSIFFYSYVFFFSGSFFI